MYKDFSARLSAICSSKQIHLEKIGHKNRLPIFMAVMNPECSRTLCFLSGLHGDEPAGPYGLLKFMEDAEKYDVKIIMFPVVNPTGFTKGTRRNHLNYDLNRHWCHDELFNKENILVYDRIKGIKFDLFITMHEDNTIDEFYLYYSDKKAKKECNAILKVAKKFFPIHKGDVHGELCHKGLVLMDRASGDCTVEDRMLAEGNHYIVVETPGALDLDRRITCQAEAVKAIVEYHENKHNEV